MSFRTFLFVSHRFCGVDMRNQITRSDEHEDADEQCGDVERDDEGQIEFCGNCADVIGGWVEFYQSCITLEENESNADDVSEKQSLSDDEYSEPQECVADGLVACTECL